ncbi:hypothetical protein Dimus_000174 [Dionaea muscipula]
MKSIKRITVWPAKIFRTRKLNTSCSLGQWKHHRWKAIKQSHSITREIRGTHLPNVIYHNIEMIQYAENGQLDAARKLFDEMPTRTVVSWNTMISAYAKRDFYTDALSLVSSMHHSFMKLNEITFTTVFSVCSRLRSLTSGEQIHCVVLKSGFERFELVGSALLYFYACCFKIHMAQRVFDSLCKWNRAVWTSMLVGYVKCNLLDDAFDLFMKFPSWEWDVTPWTMLILGYSKGEEGFEKALHLFNMMRESAEVRPNEFTLDCVLRACARVGGLREGKTVHGLVLKFGFELDRCIAGALIDLYCSCNAVGDGRRVYDTLLSPCLDASNTLIDGYISSGNVEDARIVFKSMVERTPVSYNLMIKGYAMDGRVDCSKKLFETMPMRSIFSINTMISVYSRKGDLDSALKLFEEAKGERNSVTWNSMISAYVQNDQHEEAIKLYLTMHWMPIERTRSTFSVLFRACSCLGSLQQGRLIHCHLIKTPFQSNVYVGTSLVDMYARCGSISDAEISFRCISSPNIAAWTALINGHAHNGLSSQAFVLFKEMLNHGIDPNGATFVGILSACAHGDMLDEGMSIFHSMELCCGVTPTLEHYACAVDLLGRCGHLQEAEEFIREMPIEADVVIWVTLLNACWFWMDLEVAERVAKKIMFSFSFSFNSVSAYVIMSNMYAKLGKWRETMTTRQQLRGLEVKKSPGWSWIELNNKVHVFYAGDQMHPSCKLIYQTLENLISNINLSTHSASYCSFTNSGKQ